MLDKIMRKLRNSGKKGGQDRESCIDTVCRASGWSREDAEARMKAAEDLGVSFSRYVKNEYWDQDQEELRETLRKKAEQKRKREGYIDAVTEATGWPREKTVKTMKAANTMGIPYFRYAQDYVYELSVPEMKEYVSLLLAGKKRMKEEFEYYRKIVCRRTGWSVEKATAEMEKAEKDGVSPIKYVQKEVWKSKGKKALTRAINNDKTRISDNNAGYIDTICEKTGWTRGQAKLDVLRARINCGASHEDYLVYRFWEKSPEEQRKYVTLGMFNKMRAKYNEHNVSVYNYDNKVNFNRNFAQFIRHRWFSNRNMSYEDFLKNIDGLKRIIVKPLGATKGIGIEAFDCNVSEEDNRKLYDHLVSLKESIVEEYIVQHDEISEFCRTAVNTVRVMTLNFNGECKLLYSVFRIGNGGVVDNFHAGGVAASVDVRTGKVYTNGADLDGNVATHSAATGKKIKGYQIPFWDEVVELCGKISGLYTGTNLVGWDFAITNEGVDLIEGNPGASYIVAQIPNVEDDIGLAEQMALPYIDADDEVEVTDEDHMTRLRSRVFAETVRFVSGEDQDDIEERIKAAFDAGITEDQYLRYECWKFTADEERELADLFRKQEESTAEARIIYTDEICRRTGWSTTDAERKLTAMRKKGYTAKRFITDGLYEMSDDELEALEPLEKNGNVSATFITEKMAPGFEARIKAEGISYGRGVINRLAARIEDRKVTRESAAVLEVTGR